MFTFAIQSLDWIKNGHAHFFVLFFLWVWFVWGSKALFARLYKPFTGQYRTTTSVIIPVVDEVEGLFGEALRRIVEQRPDEIIVVINGQRNLALEAICEEFAPAVHCLWTPHPGKRNALRMAIQRAKGEISVLVDSDTLWCEDTLEELLKPFANKKVGGVTTHQKIFAPERNWLTRFADWMEDIRTTYSMPSQSVLGQVGCLPGRTIAFRTCILKWALPDFMTETFLGVHMEVSDDRSLTNYTLKYGFRTVYQRTSVVYTDAPTDIKTFIRQQFRWSKGSQYNTLKMWGWMLTHTPLLLLHFTADIVSPFFLVGVFANAGWRFATNTARTPILAGTPLSSFWVQLSLGVVGAIISIGIRQVPHFRKAPRDVMLLPLFVIALTVLMTPIRIWGFIMCAIDSGWGTRPNAYRGVVGSADLPPAPTRTRLVPVYNNGIDRVERHNEYDRAYAETIDDGR